MFLIVLRAIYFLICTSAIAAFVHPSNRPPEIVEGHEIVAFLVILLITQVGTLVDVFIPRKRVEVISAVYFGLLIGVLLSYLMVQAISPVFASMKSMEVYRGGVVLVLTLMITYFSTSLLIQTRDDFRFVIPYVEFARELKGGRPLILDSSALIDGRIADVVETKILDSRMIVPDFVLKEVQDIADSQDKNRRMRGRRGLEVLAKLQQMPHAEVSVYDTKKKDLIFSGLTVDQRLVELGKDLNGRVVTSDFNLNRVAAVQGVEVVNLNDVASSLRPRYLPGDSLKVRVIREGEGQGQGVGYLDDGTMVVCEQSRDLIGKEIETTVTSVLQSSTGRMIFARPNGAPVRA
ncbi:MAG: PIN/TRAM domain-containing protein [Planctomycetes bacterium]|nr:PIN/TRAM domain-containing protein [Planctomycetota bacterium]